MKETIIEIRSEALSLCSGIEKKLELIDLPIAQSIYPVLEELKLKIDRLLSDYTQTQDATEAKKKQLSQRRRELNDNFAKQYISKDVYDKGMKTILEKENDL